MTDARWRLDDETDEVGPGIWETYNGQDVDYLGDAPSRVSGERNITKLNNLNDALVALGSMPDGYCWCFGHHRDPLKPLSEHTGECCAAKAALAKPHRKAGE